MRPISPEEHRVIVLFIAYRSGVLEVAGYAPQAYQEWESLSEQERRGWWAVYQYAQAENKRLAAIAKREQLSNDQTQYDIPDDLELAQREILQLKQHVAHTEVSIWYVYTTDAAYGPFINYQEASAKFDDCPADRYPVLMLATRIGTAVRFRYKYPVEGESQ